MYKNINLTKKKDFFSIKNLIRNKKQKKNHTLKKTLCIKFLNENTQKKKIVRIQIPKKKLEITILLQF